MFDIRKAQKSDIPTIQAMAWQVFPETYKNIISVEQSEFMMEMMYSHSSLEKQMEDGHVFFIAYEECEAAGYISVSHESEHVFHLQKLYVLPYFQGYKLGRILFEKAISAIKEMHAAPCEMHLNVNRWNEKALRFYERMGMRKIESIDAPIGSGFFMNDYIMCLDI